MPEDISTEKIVNEGDCVCPHASLSQGTVSAGNANWDREQLADFFEKGKFLELLQKYFQGELQLLYKELFDAVIKAREIGNTAPVKEFFAARLPSKADKSSLKSLAEYTAWGIEPLGMLAVKALKKQFSGKTKLTDQEKFHFEFGIALTRGLLKRFFAALNITAGEISDVDSSKTLEGFAKAQSALKEYCQENKCILWIPFGKKAKDISDPEEFQEVYREFYRALEWFSCRLAVIADGCIAMPALDDDAKLAMVDFLDDGIARAKRELRAVAPALEFPTVAKSAMTAP